MILIKVAALSSIFVIFNCVNGFLATRSGVPIRLGNFLSIGNEPETLLGAPGFRPTNSEYTTDGGIKIASIIKNVENISTAVNNLVNLIDDYKGALKAEMTVANLVNRMRLTFHVRQGFF